MTAKHYEKLSKIVVRWLMQYTSKQHFVWFVLEHSTKQNEIHWNSHDYHQNEVENPEIDIDDGHRQHCLSECCYLFSVFFSRLSLHENSENVFNDSKFWACLASYVCTYDLLEQSFNGFFLIDRKRNFLMKCPPLIKQLEGLFFSKKKHFWRQLFSCHCGFIFLENRHQTIKSRMLFPSNSIRICVTVQYQEVLLRHLLYRIFSIIEELYSK